MGHGFAAVLCAGLASFDGDPDSEARAAWLEAEFAFSVCGFAAHLAAVRYRLDASGCDPSGHVRGGKARQYFEVQSIESQRFCDLVAPLYG